MRNIFTLLLAVATLASAAQDTASHRADSAATIEAVHVIGVRPTGVEPFTLTQIRVDSTRPWSNGGDPFFTMSRWSPGVLAQSDAGSPYGYSYVRMRGMDQTRINFTLNGIPLNEMEDQGIYFSNMPDFMSNMREVQVQRGIGTSKYGTTSMAGSVNMETRSLLRREASAEVGGGSFGTVRGTAGFTTGPGRGGVSVQARGSALTTDGFRRGSGHEGGHAFAQAGRVGRTSMLKVYGFAGQSSNQMAWLAPTDEQSAADYRVNLNSPGERDRFAQRLAAATWSGWGLPNARFSATAYHTGIDGWYTADLGAPTLGRFALSSRQSGAMASASWARGGLSAILGAGYNDYRRSHTLAEESSPSDLFYRNVGYKRDAVALAKLSRTVGRIALFADLQARWVTFDYDRRASWSWGFFNPKVGARYTSGVWSAYASIARTSREATRSDMLRGYDNATPLGAGMFASDDFGAGADTFRVDPAPERCTDLEAGWSWASGGLSVSANLYLMRFSGERVGTGRTNYIGLQLRGPVAGSTRWGVEGEAAWSIGAVTLSGNWAIAWSRIDSWTDESGRAYSGVEAFASPRLMTGHSAMYRAGRSSVALTGQLVSRMFMDNTADPALSSPGYYLLGAQAGHTRGRATVTVTGGNLLSARHFLPGGVSMGRPATYPGALASFFATLKWQM